VNVGPRRLILLAGFVPTLAVVALSLYRPAALTRFEWRVYDMLVRAASPRAPGGHVVIVDVDERSLTTIGQWPWRRDLVAALIEQLRTSARRSSRSTSFSLRKIAMPTQAPIRIWRSRRRSGLEESFWVTR